MPKLHRVSHSDHLYCNTDRRTPISFGSDKGTARVVYLNNIDQYSDRAASRALAVGRVQPPLDGQRSQSNEDNPEWDVGSEGEVTKKTKKLPSVGEHKCLFEAIEF